MPLPLLNIDRVGARLTRSAFSIDRLCINQEDVEERNQQVGMMGEIYTRASTVHVWLGEGAPDTKLVFKYERRQAFMSKLSQMLGKWYSKKCVRALKIELSFDLRIPTGAENP